MATSEGTKGVPGEDVTGGGLNPLRPRVLYSAYHVQDLERSVAFYGGVLGMHELMRFQLPSGEWECVLTFVDQAKKPTGSGVILMWREGRDRPYALGEGYSRLVIKVSDLEAAVAHLGQHEVPITVPPTKAPMDLSYAMCTDPDGYTVELMQLGTRAK